MVKVTTDFQRDLVGGVWVWARVTEIVAKLKQRLLPISAWLLLFDDIFSFLAQNTDVF